MVGISKVDRLKILAVFNRRIGLLFLFVLALYFDGMDFASIYPNAQTITNSFMLIAFLGIQLQGTLYNFYYVILRNSVEGDTTSRVIENTKPKAFKGESQSRVNLFYKIYNILYICFDKSMYYMDKDARFSKPFPKWFMTLISLYGLGFQLLLMALMLIFNLQNFVIPFFIGYSVLIIIFICIRKLIL